MQRGAAAAYVAIFLVVAAGSYGVIATTDNPEAHVTEEEAEHTLVQNESIQVGDREYRVADISAEEEEGEHGGGGGIEYTGTLNWTNTSAVQTATWEANTTVTYGQGNTTYRVLIADVENPSQLQLRPEPPEQLNPRFVNGSQVVDVDIDDDGFVEQGVPIEEYVTNLTNRSTVTFSDSVTVNGTERTVTELTNESVTFEWTEPQFEEVSLGDGAVVELNGEQYLVHFESEERAYLDDNASTAYYERSEDHDAMSKRMNGFWAVTILSSISALGLIGVAFLPRRE
jgi:hypothetical protein